MCQLHTVMCICTVKCVQTPGYCMPNLRLMLWPQAPPQMVDGCRKPLSALPVSTTASGAPPTLSAAPLQGSQSSHGIRRR